MYKSRNNRIISYIMQSYKNILLSGLFEMSRENESGVALYTRKVLIKSKTDNILPKWLRFVKGIYVV